MTHGYIREAISWIPQSTIGCITHEAIITTQNHIEANRLDWHIISNKHDSLAVECPVDERDAAGRFLRASLAQTFVGRDAVEFTMGSEVQWGLNWDKKVTPIPTA